MAVRDREQKEAARRKKSGCEVAGAVPEHGGEESARTTAERSRDLQIATVAGPEGIARLRELAQGAFRRRSVHVASHVLEDALEGDTASVQVLIRILEPGKDEAATRKQGPGRSLAEIWTAEPRWEESGEETAEVGIGGREPED